MAGLLSKFLNIKIDKAPSERSELPIVDKNQELINTFGDSSTFGLLNQLNSFRMISDDRDTQYDTYDDMANDSVISAALEIYADEATQYDEQGRIIWVESEDENITKAGNRLLDLLEIPERAWKHIYMACKYGDFYLKLYRLGDDENDLDKSQSYSSQTKIVNDQTTYHNHPYTPPYEEYVEDVDDPATLFDLRKRGKCAGFVEVKRSDEDKVNLFGVQRTFNKDDVLVYSPDRFVHIMVGENLTRKTETITLDLGDSSQTFDVSRGKSVLYDVYPIQNELRLLEDALLLNRLTRSSLIRLLEIEVGDMPKHEVNPYLRRLKNLIEQHVAMDKGTGNYKSYQQPGPIENVIYIPVRNGKGHISINNLGGDVNVKDIADLDYFNAKRAGALKIPQAMLGQDNADSSGFDNGGTLTKLSARFAKTIKRIQTAYIRAITQLLNLYFLDKKLDYVNKFTVRMTSPSTAEDLERNELVNGNIEVVRNFMDLTSELEGNTQKKILEYMVTNVIKMPDIATMIHEDLTPSEDFEVDVSPTGGSAPSFSEPSGMDDIDMDFESSLDDSFGNEEPEMETPEIPEPSVEEPTEV